MREEIDEKAARVILWVLTIGIAIWAVFSLFVSSSR